MVWMKTPAGTVKKPFKPTMRRVEKESRLQTADITFLLTVACVLVAHFVTQVLFS